MAATAMNMAINAEVRNDPAVRRALSFDRQADVPVGIQSSPLVEGEGQIRSWPFKTHFLAGFSMRTLVPG